MNGILQTMRESDRQALNAALVHASDAAGCIDKDHLAVAICEFLKSLPPMFAGIVVPRETLSRLVAEVVALDRFEAGLLKRNQDGSGALSPSAHR